MGEKGSMDTKVIKIDENNIEQSMIRAAGEILKRGGLVAFPTETVYGLGGNALSKESSGKIYAAKGRPSDNPLIVHISNMEQLPAIVDHIPEEVYRLAEAFWPGPLTIILNKSELVPLETTGGLATVAVRMPANPIALALINAAGGYVAAPSANSSGKPSPTKAKHVLEDLNGSIDMIIDGGSVEIGIESTIVDLTEQRPVILRPGYITQEMLEKVLGPVSIDQAILPNSSNQKPKAPGMKYRHYAPKGSLTIIFGKSEAVISKINQLAENGKTNGRKVGVIGTDETALRYRADTVKSVGRRADEDSIARELYSILREFDEEEVEEIYSESFEACGIGQAIMNRLLKAAGHHVLNAE